MRPVHDGVADLVGPLRAQEPLQVGVDATRPHGGHGDSSARQLGGEVAGEHLQTGLAGRVRARAEHAGTRRGTGRHVDDPAEVPGEHALQGGGDDRHRRDEVEPYRRLPLRHAYAGQRSQRADVPSVVDDDVDRAELVRCGGDDLHRRRRIRQVAAHRQHDAAGIAQVTGDRSECVAATADHRDPYAAVDQQARDRGTDAPTRAGHDRNPAPERRVDAQFSTRRNQISRQYG